MTPISGGQAGAFRRATGGLLARAAVAALLMVPGPTLAQEDVQAIFEVLDEDGDGKITREEFLRTKTELFYRALVDVDQDQRLGPDEINVRPEAFAEADLDGDGKLSGSEFVQARFTQFEAIDADGDQVIRFEELRDFIERYRP